MFNYDEFKRDALRAFSRIGQQITPPESERRMTAAQIKRRRGANFVTSEHWQYRSLAGNERGPLLVEISYGFMIDSPVIGITIFHTLPEHTGADHDESGCYHSIGEAAARLEQLNGGD